MGDDKLVIDSTHPLHSLALALRYLAMKRHGVQVQPVHSCKKWALCYTTMGGKLQLWYDRPLPMMPNECTTSVIAIDIPENMQRYN